MGSTFAAVYTREKEMETHHTGVHGQLGGHMQVIPGPSLCPAATPDQLERGCLTSSAGNYNGLSRSLFLEIPFSSSVARQRNLIKMLPV
ncbi:Mitochondrial Glutamate Carrier 1 [Manis pentadactyla]|nr:Mitochondrial Glutamate Carrier 1 [Manis pentadactyla]